jgi:hypothetical protein
MSRQNCQCRHPTNPTKVTKKPPILRPPSLDSPQLMVSIAQHKPPTHPASQRSVSTTNLILMGPIRIHRSYHSRCRPRQQPPISYLPRSLHAHPGHSNASLLTQAWLVLPSLNPTVSKPGSRSSAKIGEKTAMTELTQFHDYTTYHLVHTSSLSPQDCQKALSSLINIVKKRDAHGCTRACADSSKERLEPGYKKEDGGIVGAQCRR